MGGSKLDLPFGDRTLLDWSLALAGAVADETLLLAGDRPVAPSGARSARRVDDLAGGSGPLRGLAAGLGEARHEWCLLLACDMPLLTPAAIDVLLGHAARCAPSEDGAAFASAERWQPFPALLRRGTRPAVLRQLQADDDSFQALYGMLALRRVDLEELRRIDPGLRMLSNINTPLDLRSAREPAAETAS
jgi:molybdenum cofactor guanylyltransferase